MISRLEILPNELFFSIFSYLLWNEILTSFWSLNERFNFLVCSTFSTNQTGIVINQTGLSYKTFSSKFFQLISNCSSLISSIRRIHLDGTNSNSCEFYNTNRTIFDYRNLKSLILTRCYLPESLIENLFQLIEHQLNALTLILDEDIFTACGIENNPWRRMPSHATKCLLMFKDLVRQLFSSKCQLISLRLGIPHDESVINIYQCLSSSGDYCMSLRYLHVSLHYGCFLLRIIEHVPNLERLSVYLRTPSVRTESFGLSSGTFRRSDEICYNKKLDLQKLKCFILKSVIQNDFQLNYLKWIFNNLNHVEKLTISLQIIEIPKNSGSIINGSIIDANFIRKYLMSDTIINLIHFNFYIISKYELLSNNTERVINSFKIHPFFIEHEWTNVTCVYDSTNSYQYLSSSNINISPYFQHFKYNPDIFNWPQVKYIILDFYKNTYLLLERFDQLFPNVSCIKFYMDRDHMIDNSDDSIASFKMEQHKLTNIHLQYVTRLDFGLYCYRSDSKFYRSDGCYDRDEDQCEERSRLLAHLISMPNQLNYLRIHQFQWLLDLIEYAFDQLRKNALSAVKYVEFCLPSCNFGTNQSVDLGKSLVPFLSDYIPHLQTLRLWRKDDFPWTSIRPHFELKHRRTMALQWNKSLETLQSINEHANVFEEDLSQLIENLKQFVYLDIHGQINHEKVESYRLMVQKRFPNTYFSIEKTRFRLWI